MSNIRTPEPAERLACFDPDFRLIGTLPARTLESVVGPMWPDPHLSVRIATEQPKAPVGDYDMPRVPEHAIVRLDVITVGASWSRNSGYAVASDSPLDLLRKVDGFRPLADVDQVSSPMDEANA